MGHTDSGSGRALPDPQTAVGTCAIAGNRPPLAAAMMPYVPYHTVERLRYKAESVNGKLKNYFWLCKYRRIRHLRVFLGLLSGDFGVETGRRRVEDGPMDAGATVPENDGLPKPDDNMPPGKGRGGRRGRRRWKGIGLALGLLAAAIGVTAWFLRDRTPDGPPLILTLPGGEKYRFMGTTYGTRNVPPSFDAKVVSVLPDRLANLARKRVGPQISQYNQGQKFDSPNLFIWFQRVGTNVSVWPPGQTFDARLADEAGIEAGVVDYPPGFRSPGVAWHYTSFSVIPRRSRVLQLNFYPDYVGGHSSGPVGSVKVPNPLYGKYPQWKPEPIPAVKKAGDLEVRLDDFVTGSQVGGATVAKANGSWNLPFDRAEKGQKTATGFDFSVRFSRGTNEVWVLHSAELSDATGNVLRNTLLQTLIEPFEGYGPPQLAGWGAYSESIHGTLWPDEAAWRLKLEFKRASGFAPEEVVTFKDVPVPAVGTNTYPGWTKKAGGIKVALSKFERIPYHSRWSMFGLMPQVTVELPGKPMGVALDFLGMKADAGQVKRHDFGRPDAFAYTFWVDSIPTNAKTMDFTFVVQKTRMVEFLVKPPKGE